MVYVFDPTTCEEPKKPTYRYSPIPKTVKYCCCPKPVEEEAGEKPTEAVDRVSGTENEVVNETVPTGEQDG